MSTPEVTVVLDDPEVRTVVVDRTPNVEIALGVIPVPVGEGDTDLSAVEARLDELEADVTGIDLAASILAGRVSTTEGDIDALQAGLTAAEGATTTLAGRVTTAESDIDALTSSASTLAGRVTTAEGDIDVVEAAVAGKQPASANLTAWSAIAVAVGWATALATALGSGWAAVLAVALGEGWAAALAGPRREHRAVSGAQNPPTGSPGVLTWSSPADVDGGWTWDSSTSSWIAPARLVGKTPKASAKSAISSSPSARPVYVVLERDGGSAAWTVVDEGTFQSIASVAPLPGGRIEITGARMAAIVSGERVRVRAQSVTSGGTQPTINLVLLIEDT